MTAAPVIGLIAKPETSIALYADAISRTGGIPRLIDSDAIRAPSEIIAEIAGLLIGGESDFDHLDHTLFSSEKVRDKYSNV